MKKLALSDTTLRDGEQTPGVRFRPEQKVQIAMALAEAGIETIDAGFPAAAPEESEAIRRIVREVPGPVITAFCRCVQADIDKAGQALAEASVFKRGISLFIGTSPIHRQRKLGKTKAEIIKLIVDAIQYASRFAAIVVFGPEDASRTEPEFLYEIYREAIAAGVFSLGFTDTVGILTPGQASDCIKGIQDHVPNLAKVLLGVHFHNDLGLATANALACVAQGINIVQGTINGLGERAGNTALEEVAMALHLHRDLYKVSCPVDVHRLWALSRLVAQVSGMPTPPNKAVVGENLFLTASGIHQDGMLKDPQTYLPFPPEEIGAAPVRLVLGKHSGRHAVRHLFERLGRTLTDEQIDRIVAHLKGPARKALYNSDADLEELWREVFPANS